MENVLNFNIFNHSKNLQNIAEVAENSSDAEWANSLPVNVLLITDTVIVTAWSVLANSIILGAFIVDPKLRQKAHFYGVSLALSDLIGTINLGFGCYFFLYQSWVVKSPGLCKFWNAVDYTTGLLASLTIALISYDRYKMVFHPDEYRTEESTKRILTRVIGVWIFSFLFYVPATVFWDVIAGYSVISIDDCDPEFKNALYMTILQSAVEFIVPFSVILYCNVKLIRFVRKRALRMGEMKLFLQQHPRELTVFNINSSLQEEIEARIFERERLKTEIRDINKGKSTTISLGVLVGVFFLFWFPWEVVGNFMDPICGCVPIDFYQAAYWAQYHSFAVNSLVYGVTVEPFRKHFKKFVRFFTCGQVRQRLQLASASAVGPTSLKI